jgi:hypothetical protein
VSTQYRLVQSGKTASGGCSADQGSSEPVAPRIYYFYLFIYDQVLIGIKTTPLTAKPTIKNDTEPLPSTSHPRKLFMLRSMLMLFPYFLLRRHSLFPP